MTGGLASLADTTDEAKTILTIYTGTASVGDNETCAGVDFTFFQKQAKSVQAL